MISLSVLALLAALAAGAGVVFARVSARRAAEAAAAAERRVAEAIRGSAAGECAEIRRAAEIAAREEALLAGAAFDVVSELRETELSARRAKLGNRVREIERLAEDVAESRRTLEAARARQRAHDDDARRARAERERHGEERRTLVERRAGETVAGLRKGIIDAEAEEARLAGAQLLRAVEQTVADPEQIRRARRVMGIAVGRFSGHYLTERLLSLVPAPVGVPLGLLAGKAEANLRAIEGACNVKLAIAEGQDAVRLEGLDGVGREVARRSLAWIGRNAAAAADPAAVEAAARTIAATLERELFELGRRAFATLQIAEAHADIVRLVGRLNYRTSFTQNQWKHAIEAAFLCGMMADELGLDVKLARRAALMHDIGKALTHELDGSHAVIGADYARRLGEAEVVANAIGAHHTDEPFASPYAYLVAAADAMSGARPGARRQMEDNYVARLDDLERITRSFAGVEEAYAVQGGREVRVYVQEDKMDDLGAVNLSGEIARRISAEMTFPGQIRVTVIRELKAVEVAS
jgi:ribonuclease Y